MTRSRHALALLVATPALAACGDSDGVGETTRTDGGGGPVQGEPSTVSAEPVPCGDVGFTPASDNGAFAIEATGVSCATAREVAAGAEQRLGDAYEAQGFSCTGVPGRTELPSTEYTCTRGEARVTFSAS